MGGVSGLQYNPNGSPEPAVTVAIPEGIPLGMAIGIPWV